MLERVLDTPLTFHGEGLYHIETSPLICRANQWTGFYLIKAAVVKELNSANFSYGEITI